MKSLPNSASHASNLTNVEQVEFNAGKHVIKKGRGHTINAKFQKKKEKLMEKGKSIGIKFPPPFYKICGKHAKYFKYEAQVSIPQKVPLQVNDWSEISKDDVDEMWRHMKERSLTNKAN
ncbi:hypothetical protein GmHk_02G005141 [Glycine max]|nr:hypothetical protein GmHk_02G005141 [Glycine max]